MLANKIVSIFTNEIHLQKQDIYITVEVFPL